MIKVSEIENALKEIESCEEIVRPYEHTGVGSSILKGLSQIRDLLKEPSKEKVEQCLAMIKVGENALMPHSHMSAVQDLLKHLSNLSEYLKNIRESLEQQES